MPYGSRAGSKPSRAKLNTTCRRAWPSSGSHIDSYLWPMLTTGDPSGHFPADWVQLKLLGSRIEELKPDKVHVFSSSCSLLLHF